MTKYVDIVFDGPPSHMSGRFVEVENDSGASINFGEWIQRAGGYWALRLYRAPHTHVAGGIHIDQCKRCGHDIRHGIHSESNRVLL